MKKISLICILMTLFISTHAFADVLTCNKYNQDSTECQAAEDVLDFLDMYSDPLGSGAAGNDDNVGCASETKNHDDGVSLYVTCCTESTCAFVQCFAPNGGSARCSEPVIL